MTLYSYNSKIVSDMEGLSIHLDSYKSLSLKTEDGLISNYTEEDNCRSLAGVRTALDILESALISGFVTEPSDIMYAVKKMTFMFPSTMGKIHLH